MPGFYSQRAGERQGEKGLSGIGVLLYLSVLMAFSGAVAIGYETRIHRNDMIGRLGYYIEWADGKPEISKRDKINFAKKARQDWNKVLKEGIDLHGYSNTELDRIRDLYEREMGEIPPERRQFAGEATEAEDVLAFM